MKTGIKTKNGIIVAVVLLLAALLASMTATYAWFSISTRTKVASLELFADAGPQLRFDTVHHYDEYGNIDLYSYLTHVPFERIAQQVYNAKGYDIFALELDPVTSGNGRDMYFREENENGGDPVSGDIPPYMEFVFYFVAEHSMWVHLTSESSKGADDGTRLTPISIGLKANIVKAVRMSFSADSTGTAVFEPNKDGKTVLVGQAASQAERDTFDLPPSDKMVYSDATRICYVEAGKETAVTVRIWAEGDDPDCNDLVASGIFDLQLAFAGTDENNVKIKSGSDDSETPAPETTAPETTAPETTVPQTQVRYMPESPAKEHGNGVFFDAKKRFSSYLYI